MIFIITILWGEVKPTGAQENRSFPGHHRKREHHLDEQRFPRMNIQGRCLCSQPTIDQKVYANDRSRIWKGHLFYKKMYRCNDRHK